MSSKGRVQCCVRRVDRFVGVSVMPLGVFDANIRTHLVVIQENMTAMAYRDQVLKHGLSLTFQHDTATPYAARLTEC